MRSILLTRERTLLARSGTFVRLFAPAARGASVISRMKLQTKLVGSFVAVAFVGLAASFVGYWEVREIGSALYEIGVVRLPSLEGLNAISRGRAALAASQRVLLIPGADDSTVVVELARQREASSVVADGWMQYQPLPPQHLYRS